MTAQLGPQAMNDSTTDEALLRYRSVSAPAILSIVVGIFSILTVFGWVFWIIPLLALVLGWRALKSIEAAPEEYTGAGLAYSGIATALVLWLLGFGIHHYKQKYSVPSGYKVVTFDDLQPASKNVIIPPLAFDLEPTDKDRNKRIYIEGYIYPGRRTIGIKEFVLIPTLGHCQFCRRDLASTEMISVKFTGDLTTNYTTSLVRVGGKFHVDRQQATNPFGGLPYKLETDYFQD